MCFSCKLTFASVTEGDNKNCILLWEPTSDSKWNVDSTPFIGHSGSVEDLQVCSCSLELFLICWNM